MPRSYKIGDWVRHSDANKSGEIISITPGNGGIMWYVVKWGDGVCASHNSYQIKPLF